MASDYLAFSENFGAWLEANGLPIEVRPAGGWIPGLETPRHVLYSPGPIDLNTLKVAVFRLMYEWGGWTEHETSHDDAFAVGCKFCDWEDKHQMSFDWDLAGEDFRG